MKKFKTLISNYISIRTENIDTDQIIPAQFLKTTKKDDLGKYLFYKWRFDNFGKRTKNNRFDDSNHHNNKILIAGNNFGCGSSREHAVWALVDYGFKVVISSSFGDIFYGNSFKNGLLLIVIQKNEVEKLFATVNNPNTKIIIDLKKQTIGIPSKSILIPFKIDEFKKNSLLNGTDELDFILSQKKKIAEFEKRHKLYLNIHN
ncbi:3-isopropylmalate dehydratase small subunit [Candidatus Gottesmanbacteria bacterium]|nr:3-isopropylmalate dehydratase small subunit [Candidatus Gottesmanbacteria bacterium]